MLTCKQCCVQVNIFCFIVYQGFGLIGKKKVVNKTLKVRTPQLARESVRLINQAYEEYRATLSLAKQ